MIVQSQIDGTRIVNEPESPKPPDLQEWIARYGGYWSIPWDEWERAVAAYDADRRQHYDGRMVRIDDVLRTGQARRSP